MCAMKPAPKLLGCPCFLAFEAKIGPISIYLSKLGAKNNIIFTGTPWKTVAFFGNLEVDVFGQGDAKLSGNCESVPVQTQSQTQFGKLDSSREFSEDVRLIHVRGW